AARAGARRGRAADVRRASWPFQREEQAVAPHAARGAAAGERELGKLIINSARKLGLEPVPNDEARRGADWGVDDVEAVVTAEDQRVAAIEPERDALVAAFAVAGHLDRPERRGLDIDVELLRRRDQHVTA